MSRRKDNPVKSLLNSFGYAVRGLLLCLREERNLRIHLAASCWVIWLGRLCQISRGEWAALAVCCGLVITSEIFNTSVEATVDLLSPGYHPVARRAKDIAAAGVLMGAVFAVLTGAILFWDKLDRLVLWLADFSWSREGLYFLAACALTVGFIFGFPSLINHDSRNNREEKDHFD